MSADPIAALLEALPQREHVPRWYAGPMGPDWKPGRGPYRPSCWSKYAGLIDRETLYTEDWYQARESAARRTAYANRHVV